MTDSPLTESRDLARLLYGILREQPNDLGDFDERLEFDRLPDWLTSPEAPSGEWCGLYAHSPLSHHLGQCVGPAVEEVIAPVTTSGGEFRGDGVRVLVCAGHGAYLRETYGALAVPERASSVA